MEINNLNALRLGFSTRDAHKIKTLGLKGYISSQVNGNAALEEPDFIKTSFKSLQELQQLREAAQKNGDELEKIAKQINRLSFEWKAFILERCNETEFPLKEKINLFFQNHFVTTLQSVKVPFWTFKYYETIHNGSLGNYKTLVREVVYSNAMIKYLDNQQNRRGKINENLGRELLELFTLGEGHYTESDIKNTALSLAGLNFGQEHGIYRPMLKDNSVKTVFGKSGNFIIDDVIDIIFEQKNTPYFLAEKLLKWFFYDNPDQKLVTKYGDLLKEYKFELKPFFEDFFYSECQNKTGGNQIKNPLTYLCQIFNDLNLTPNYMLWAFVLRNQAMDVFDQPNVKGWKGGQDWLTAQIYSNRNQLIDFIVSGNKQYEKFLSRNLERFDGEKLDINPKLVVANKDNAKAIIRELTDRMIFQVSEDMMSELDQILKYDFDPKAANADKAILNVYQFLAKSPEFQII